MTNKDAAAVPGFTVLCAGEEREIRSFYCCDLLSHVMGQVLEDTCWCTVMGNINTIAVATLAEAACVVLCHGIPATEEMLRRAGENGVTVLSTNMAQFDAAVALAKAGGIAL